MTHIYNGILLSHKKKWNWVICSEVYGPIAQGDNVCALWPPRGVGYRGWGGDARGRRYEDIYICIADSLCCKAETNTQL